MNHRFAGLFVVASLTAGLAVADAPGASPRPIVRPDAQVLADVSAPAGLVLASASISPVAAQSGPILRPRARDGVFAVSAVRADSAVQVTRQTTRIHFDAAFRPSARPAHPLDGYEVVSASARIAPEADAAHPKARPAMFGKLFGKRDGGYSSKGAVCGVNAIKGVELPAVGKPSSACGIANPVQVTEVSGVRLSTPATIDCTTAQALNTWVSKGVKPAVGRRGGGVAEINVFATYACRTRNNSPSGKLSEHAKGHAVDVGGFTLKNGTELTVLNGWRSKKDAKVMKKIHASACGPFGTVLGPNADRFHQDHIHVDTARYRSGTYCK